MKTNIKICSDAIVKVLNKLKEDGSFLYGKCLYFKICPICSKKLNIKRKFEKISFGGTFISYSCSSCDFNDMKYV